MLEVEPVGIELADSRGRDEHAWLIAGFYNIQGREESLTEGLV